MSATSDESQADYIQELINIHDMCSTHVYVFFDVKNKNKKDKVISSER